MGSGFRDGDAPKGRQGSVSNTEGTAVAVHMERSALFGESHTRVSVSGSNNPNTVLKDLQMKM